MNHSEVRYTTERDLRRINEIVHFYPRGNGNDGTVASREAEVGHIRQLSSPIQPPVHLAFWEAVILVEVLLAQVLHQVASDHYVRTQASEWVIN